MTMRANDRVKKVTSQLNEELVREMALDRKEVTFHPVPHHAEAAAELPTWRIRLDLEYDTRIRMGLDVNGEVVLGRGPGDENLVVLFSSEDAGQLGVSRMHALLRPTPTKLYLIDLDSTNGTWINGHSIGVNMPYSLSNGDIVKLGSLEFIVNILKHPAGQTGMLQSPQDLAEVLPDIAKAITSQLIHEDVMKQSLEMIMNHTSASSASVWLVDEQTGDLYLEMGLGLDEGHVQRISSENTLVGKVVKTGEPMTVNRDASGEQIKLKTGYLVEAVMYVPLKLADVTIGVLSATHREAGQLFAKREEKVMRAIADCAAIALQNARIHEASERGLHRRSKILTAINYALSYDFKQQANAIIGYAGMLKSFGEIDDYSADIVEDMIASGNTTMDLIERLIQITNLTESPPDIHDHCDLNAAVIRAVEESRAKAVARNTVIQYKLHGDPFMIQGDTRYLYRSVINLLDNAIKFSPEGSLVAVDLAFWQDEIVIRVLDNGPGIPEEDLPHLFDRYFRTAQKSDGCPAIGLGLELIRATVEAHRGTVIARNAEDGGAELIIKLPASLRVM